MAEVPGSVNYNSGGSMFDGLAGGLAGGLFSYLGQEEANRSNKQMAQQQMSFQELMDSTKYQRTVRDLQAAGLNPMMAYGNMSAGSPSGALGHAAQNSLGSAVEAFNRSSGTSADVNLKREQEATQKAITISTLAQADKTKQDEHTSKAQELNSIADAQLKASTMRLNSANEAKTRAETSFIDAQRAEVAAKQPGWNMIQGVTQKIKDISESNSAQNVKRAADSVRSMRFQGVRENPRSITIYGDSK